MKPPMSSYTSVRLSGDTYSNVSTYRDRGPIWGLTSARAEHRTGLSLYVDENASLAEMDALADRFETDAHEFVSALRAEAERIRTNQRSGVAKVASASGGGGDG